MGEIPYSVRGQRIAPLGYAAYKLSTASDIIIPNNTDIILEDWVEEPNITPKNITNTSGVIKVTTPGVYRIECSVCYDSASDIVNQFNLQIRLNGVTKKNDALKNSGGDHGYDRRLMRVTGTFRLETTDAITIQIYALKSSGSLKILSTNDVLSDLTIFQLAY